VLCLFTSRLNLSDPRSTGGLCFASYELTRTKGRHSLSAFALKGVAVSHICPLLMSYSLQMIQSNSRKYLRPVGGLGATTPKSFPPLNVCGKWHPPSSHFFRPVGGYRRNPHQCLLSHLCGCEPLSQVIPSPRDLDEGSGFLFEEAHRVFPPLFIFKDFISFLGAIVYPQCLGIGLRISWQDYPFSPFALTALGALQPASCALS